MNVEREFRELLDSKCSRDQVVEYLASHPKLLPVWLPRDSRMFRDLHLFDNEYADFAYHREDTHGELWRFFRIASPNARLREGDAASNELLLELKKLRAWKAWFQTNLENRCHVSPIQCAEFVAYEPEIYLVIGRSEELEAFQNQEAPEWPFAYSQDYANIHWQTFDSLFAALSQSHWRNKQQIEMVRFEHGKTNVIATFPNES